MSSPINRDRQNDNQKSSTTEPKPNSSNNDEDEKTDIDSIYSLEVEVSQYMETRESNVYDVYPGAEMLNYDFTLERYHIHSTNLIESTSHLIKSCLGTGILSIHEGYKIGGLWTSLACTFFVGMICYYVMYILVKSAQKMYGRLRVPRLSYPDLAEVALATGPITFMRRFSKVFRYIVDTCLFVAMSGSCCIYVIMIANTLKQVLEGTSDTVKAWDMSIRMYILMIMPPLILLSIIRNLKYLAPFSLIADVIVGVCVITTMYYGFSAVKLVSFKDRPAWKSFPGFFHILGITLFGVNGVGVTLPIENNMKKPLYFPTVLQFGMTIVVICIAVTGFSGYLGWGEDCKSPITIHMPLNMVSMLLQYLLAVMLSVTFAVTFWVSFRTVWHYIGRKHKRKRGIWERVYRVIHVILITLLTLTLPNMINIVIFIGNIVLAFISLIIPAFLDTLITWQEHKGFIRWRLLINTMIMMFGGVLCGAWFYSSSE